MGLEKYNYDIQRKTLEPKRKESEHERRKSREKYIKQQRRQVDIAKKMQAKRIVFYVVILFSMASVILLKFNSIHMLQREIESIKQESRTISEHNEDLNIKISESISLEKIEKVAKEKLNMVYPTREDAVNIKP
ncbi:MAG: hypothetical protein ACRDDL_07945 [Sarcina sp.]